MRVISRKPLRDFGIKHPAAQAELEAWYAEARAASWTTPANVKAKYGSASILKNGRVVFNICGNKYRLIARINYDFQIVFIRFVGTHKEYDKVDAEDV